jgi:hypothetical protein
MKKKIQKAVEWILYKQIPAWMLIVAIILWIVL